MRYYPSSGFTCMPWLLRARWAAIWQGFFIITIKSILRYLYSVCRYCHANYGAVNYFDFFIEKRTDAARMVSKSARKCLLLFIDHFAYLHPLFFTQTTDPFKICGTVFGLWDVLSILLFSEICGGVWTTCLAEYFYHVELWHWAGQIYGGWMGVCVSCL